MGLNKIAIVGFTQHRAFAPFNDNGWEKWGLNDLYLDMPESVDPKTLRWFQVHEWVEPTKHSKELVTAHPLNFAGGPPHPRDANHVPWLAEAAKHIPVYLMEPRKEVPDARIYPKAEVFTYFSLDGEQECHYFTNTISWMLALAIMELVPGGPGTKCVDGAELGVWGVDMMMGGGEGSEYGYQRPSCEWLLGWARAAGIKVHVPKESDLLHTAFVYGDHTGNVFRVKLANHKAELQARQRDVVNQRFQMQMGEAELKGAISSLQWIEQSWMPGDDPRGVGGTVPLPNMHKVPQST